MKGAKDVFMYVLGALVTIGFFTILWFLIKQGSFESTINLAIGSLIGAFATIVSYFYGSSKGSADKNEMINKK